jgi:hypothetical protein
MRQKKEFTDMLANPNQPPPQMKTVDVITQVEKVNKDVGENEVKLEFKFGKDALKVLGGGWCEYTLALEEGGKLEGKFDAKQEKVTLVLKLAAANKRSAIRDLRKSELVIDFKRKKFLFTEDVDKLSIKLTDLYSHCTSTKSYKLAA